MDSSTLETQSDGAREKLVDAALKHGPLFIIIVMILLGSYNLANRFLDGFLEDYKRSVDANVSMATDFRAFVTTWNPNYQPPIKTPD